VVDLDLCPNLATSDTPQGENAIPDKIDQWIADMGLYPKRDSATYRRYRKVLKDVLLEGSDLGISAFAEAAAIGLAAKISKSLKGK
jgi:hypothetical protein